MKYDQKTKHDLLQLMTTTQHLPSNGGSLSHHTYFVRVPYVSGIIYPYSLLHRIMRYFEHALYCEFKLIVQPIDRTYM